MAESSLSKPATTAVKTSKASRFGWGLYPEGYKPQVHGPYNPGRYYGTRKYTLGFEPLTSQVELCTNNQHLQNLTSLSSLLSTAFTMSFILDVRPLTGQTTEIC